MIVLPGTNMATIPNIINTITATKRTPPMTYMKKWYFISEKLLEKNVFFFRILPWNPISSGMRIMLKPNICQLLCQWPLRSFFEEQKLSQKIIRKIKNKISTSCTLYRADMVPKRKLWANVNSAKNMKFIGALRLTFVQHAIDIIVTSITPNATHIISVNFVTLKISQFSTLFFDKNTWMSCHPILSWIMVYEQCNYTECYRKLTLQIKTSQH